MKLAHPPKTLPDGTVEPAHDKDAATLGFIIAVVGFVIVFLIAVL